MAGEVLQTGNTDGVLQKHNAGTERKNNGTEVVAVSGNVFAKMIDMGNILKDHESFPTETKGPL